ncbi:MAG: WxL domain-containing protein [Anaerolineales bacterium]|nr:WxL domain-containing protein [Anaerolineales bacterium]
MNHKRCAQALVLAFALALGMVGYAFADATVVVSGGSLSVTGQSISFTATLTGADQTVTDNDATNWAAADPTGTGSGWHVNISATELTDGGTPAKTIAVNNFKVKLDAGNIATVAGTTAPSTQIAAYTPLSGVAQSLLSAGATEGMGSYTFVPDFSLDLAAETYAATYTSTVTVAIVAGP